MLPLPCIRVEIHIIFAAIAKNRICHDDDDDRVKNKNNFMMSVEEKIISSALHTLYGPLYFIML